MLINAQNYLVTDFGVLADGYTLNSQVVITKKT